MKEQTTSGPKIGHSPKSENYIENLEYIDGKLYRRIGHHESKGYRVFTIDGKQYKEHRVIWEMHHGPIPKGMQIDHINRIKDDNRIENLRLVTHTQNQWNKDPKGYTWNKADQVWQAQIQRDGKIRYLGRYNTETEARNAYLKAKEEHNEYIRRRL